MSYWICCNSCFLSPSADRKLALTTCGHVICSVCFQKGKPGKCLICNAKCQVSPLTDKSSSEVKALFSDINVVTTNHFTEISKVIMFQARHQKRLLTYYQQRNEKLEEVLVNMKQEMQQMAKKLNEQSVYIKKLENSLQHQSARVSAVPQMSHGPHTPHGHKSVLQIPYNSPMSLSRHSSATNITENMDVDERSLFRKPITAPRLSLISPPQDGRMAGSDSLPRVVHGSGSPVAPFPAAGPSSTAGASSSTAGASSSTAGASSSGVSESTVPHRSSNQNMLANHSARSATVSRFQGSPATSDISYSQSSRWKSPTFNPLPSFRHSMSSLVCPPP